MIGIEAVATSQGSYLPPVLRAIKIPKDKIKIRLKDYRKKFHILINAIVKVKFLYLSYYPYKIECLNFL